MKEDKFYAILDNVEKLGDVTGGGYPTVDEMERYKAGDEPEKYIISLAYFASDPFTRMNLSEKDDPEYKKTVSYAKKALYKIEIS